MRRISIGIAAVLLAGCVHKAPPPGADTVGTPRQSYEDPAVVREIEENAARARANGGASNSCDPMHSNRSYADAMECASSAFAREDRQLAIWWWRVAYRIADDQRQACPPVLSILHYSKAPGADLEGVDAMLPEQCRRRVASCTDRCKTEFNACNAARGEDCVRKAEACLNTCNNE